MTTYDVDLKVPPHPGQLIARGLMRNRRMTVAQIAEKTGIGQADLKRVIEGEMPITGEFAERMRQAFGRVADTLLSVQFVYDFYRSTGRRPTPSERAGR